MFSLIPKDEKYFTMLSELATRVHSGTEVFVKIFDDYENRTKYADEIKAIEVACDTVAARITGRLNTSFITPIDREDIYLLVKELDDVIDTVNSLAIRFDMFSVHSLRPEAREMAEILRLATAELEGAFHLLEKNQNISEHCRQINVLENRGDKLYRASIKDLFIQEKDAIEVIKWMAIYEALETAVDRCKDVAETVEAVVVKNK